MKVYYIAIAEAWRLLTSGDALVMPVIGMSLTVSGSAVAMAALIGIPLGYMLGLSRFGGRAALMVLVNTSMGFPPVVVGLFVYLALTRWGPLGFLDMLFTPRAMVVAQVFLATPLVIGVTASAVASVARDLRLQLRALGASRLQEGLAIILEARRGVMASVIAGFGAIISEVGAVSIVGGGIEGKTEVMTTAIVANVGRGDFGIAMAWAFILIGIALMINVALTTVQNLGSAYDR
ncbi:MAG: ABC transporter permease [Coriobacteriia bacterium]|nr:ABC transporter permease [Coriobacteriia bacterium]